MATNIWLNASLSINLSKKKKLKLTISNDDYDQAFENLWRTVSEKMLRRSPSVELSKPEMVYKSEEDLNEEESTRLEEATDLEGLLEEFPGGKGVRVIVTINDMDELGSIGVASSSAGSAVQNPPFARTASIDLPAIYEALKVAARKPGPEELSYFVNPLTGQVQDVRLADFKGNELATRGGDSSYGKVFEATYNNARFAIKRIDGLLMDSDKPALAFEREMTFLRKTTDWNCRNIVQFHGFIRTGDTARLILELMDKDMSEVIDSLKSSGFYNRVKEEASDLEAMGYILLRDISNGLRFTHGQNTNEETFMHRDIKSSNIMVKRAEYRFAIIDFGSTKKITGEENKFHSFGAGQPYYAAPETLDFMPHYSESCDIWSMGVTMIKFVTGKHPIWDDTSEGSSSSDEYINNTKRDNIVYCRIKGKDHDGEKYDWPIGLTSEFLSQGFKDAINACVNREPGKRPTAQRVYEIAKKNANSIDPFRVQRLFEKFFGSE